MRKACIGVGAGKASFPFRIDRAAHRSLVDQMADGIRTAVETGFWKTGDMLPTMSEFAEAFGVSTRVPFSAVEKLAEEGLLESRPHVGTTVLPVRRHCWKGHVLFVRPSLDETSFYANALTGELQRRLLAADVLFTGIVLPSSPRGADIRTLEHVLGQPYNLAVLYYPTPRTVRCVMRAGLRHVIVRGPAIRSPLQCGRIELSLGAAASAFVAHCVRAGVRRVVEVGHPDSIGSEIAPLLAATGISCERVNLAVPPGFGHAERLERAALADLYARDVPKDGALWLFDDESLAAGAILALVERGYRFPRDIRIATVANAGCGPVCRQSVTRFEFDAIAHGALLSSLTLSAIVSKEGGCVAADLSPDYLVGDTFPEPGGPV